MKPTRPRVLVVDDDAAIRRALHRALGLEGFAVDVAGGGAPALAVLDAQPPDVVVLDVVMPDVGGVEVVRRLRGRGNRVPILMLSARDEVADRVAGLRAGADDYVVKPFELDELVARLHALLRRTPRGEDGPRRVDDLTVDAERRLVHRGTREIALTNREFAVLDALARDPGIVLSRIQLLERVWGDAMAADPNAVDVVVSSLRRKLEAAGEPRLLHTVRGLGFVLRGERAPGAGVGA